jgi:hypothetical protein
MNNILRSTFASSALLLACAGSVHALEVIEEGSVRMPLTPVSEAQRQADLALGNCLARNGGRMERCGTQQARSENIARADKELAPRPTESVVTSTLPAPGTPVIVEPGPVVTEGPLSSQPLPPAAK